jgi:hypothetical protein
MSVIEAPALDCFDQRRMAQRTSAGGDSEARLRGDAASFDAEAWTARFRV